VKINSFLTGSRDMGEDATGPYEKEKDQGPSYGTVRKPQTSGRGNPIALQFPSIRGERGGWDTLGGGEAPEGSVFLNPAHKSQKGQIEDLDDKN